MSGQSLQLINITKLFIDGLFTDRMFGALLLSRPLPDPIQRLRCIAFGGFSGDSILEDEFIHGGSF